MRITVRFHPPSFTKTQLSRLKRGAKSHVHLDINEMFSLLRPVFSMSRYGLYLSRFGAMGGTEMRDQFLDIGRFLSEGASNHIHLDCVVADPLHQFRVGILAVETWGAEIARQHLKGDFVIYLNHSNKSRNYTLCIYSNPTTKELRALESLWKETIQILTISRFLKTMHSSGII
jgi:hypothetical protein